MFPSRFPCHLWLLVFFLGTAHRPREHVLTTIRLRKFVHVYIYLFILDYRIISCKFKELFINLNIYTRIKYDLTLSCFLFCNKNWHIMSWTWSCCIKFLQLHQSLSPSYHQFYIFYLYAFCGCKITFSDVSK